MKAIYIKHVNRQAVLLQRFWPDAFLISALYQTNKGKKVI